jgi:hypothetical protein
MMTKTMMTSVLSNFELRAPHLAIPSVESCTGSARHGDFWQLKPLNGSLSQWHTTPNSNLDEALGRRQHRLAANGFERQTSNQRPAAIQLVAAHRQLAKY